MVLIPPYAPATAAVAHDEEALDCPAKAAYEASGKSKIILLSMCIGLVSTSSNDQDDVHGRHARRLPRLLGDVTVEPYRSSRSKRFFKPSLKDLVREVQRRLVVLPTTRGRIRTEHKGKPYLTAWLCRNPVTDPVDVAFLRREEHKFMKDLYKNRQGGSSLPIEPSCPRPTKKPRWSSAAPPPDSDDDDIGDNDRDDSASRRRTQQQPPTVEQPTAAAEEVGTVLATTTTTNALVVAGRLHPGAIPPCLPAPMPPMDAVGAVVGAMSSRKRRNVAEKVASYELVSKMQGEILALTEKMGSIADPSLKALYGEILAKTKQRCLAAEAAYDEYL